MEQRYLRHYGGRYEADIDITVEEWKSMLQNPKIFNQESLDLIFNWYDEIDHRTTTQAIMAKYPSYLKKSPYNGIVVGLTTLIVKNFNLFEVIDTEGKKTKFIVPFEGWHEDYKEGNHFVGR